MDFVTRDKAYCANDPLNRVNLYIIILLFIKDFLLRTMIFLKMERFNKDKLDQMRKAHEIE